MLPGRLGLHPLLNSPCRHGTKQSVQDGQIDPFMSEGKIKVSSDGIARLVARGENVPASFPANGVLFADGDHFVGGRYAQIMSGDKGCIAGRPRHGRHGNAGDGLNMGG